MKLNPLHAIDFYKSVFGAQEVMRMPDPKGRIGHAEIRVGDSVIMMADQHQEMGYRDPRALVVDPSGAGWLGLEGTPARLASWS